MSLNGWCDDDKVAEEAAAAAAAATQQQEQVLQAADGVQPTPTPVEPEVMLPEDEPVVYDELVAAVESFDRAINDALDLSEIHQDMLARGTMSRSVAQEARDIFPGFDKNMPISAYSNEPTTTRYNVAVEEISVAIGAAIAVAVAAIGVIVWKLVAWMRGVKPDGDAPTTVSGIIALVKDSPTTDDQKAAADAAAAANGAVQDAVFTVVEVIEATAGEQPLLLTYQPKDGGEKVEKTIKTAADIKEVFSDAEINLGLQSKLAASIEMNAHYHDTFLKEYTKALDLLKKCVENSKKTNEAVKSKDADAISAVQDEYQKLMGGVKEARDAMKKCETDMGNLHTDTFKGRQDADKQAEFVHRLVQHQDDANSLMLSCVEHIGELEKIEAAVHTKSADDKTDGKSKGKTKNAKTPPELANARTTLQAITFMVGDTTKLVREWELGTAKAVGAMTKVKAIVNSLAAKNPEAKEKLEKANEAIVAAEEKASSVGEKSSILGRLVDGVKNVKEKLSGKSEPKKKAA